MGRLSKTLFAISPTEATFARRGFHAGEQATRELLERSAQAFLGGYHAALEEPRAAALGRRLAGFDHDLSGFAHEGAGMGLAILDALSPWRGRRVSAFLAGPAAPHVYLVHVGVGWAAARVPFATRRLLAPLDGLLRWLAFDGHGFHDGFFAAGRTVRRQVVPARLHGYARRAYDQGVGRSVWFSEAADPERIAATVTSFSPARRADLWSGVGLACAYAGGAGAAAITRLRAAAGPWLPHAAQGAAFAAKARAMAGNLTAATDLACRLLCGHGAAATAALTDDTLAALPPESSAAPAAPAGEPPWESWRIATRRRLAGQEVLSA